MTITGKARLAGVMGWPVSHSLSPRIHNYWLNQLGIDGAYVPLAVAPENLADTLSTISKLGFVGVNITIPHKEAALAAMDRLDDPARHVGAVNTVTVEGDGLRGGNTDGFGFMASLRSGMPDLDLGSGPVVVLGAGGAARGIVAALMDSSAGDIRLLNRTRSRAESLAADMNNDIQVLDWDARAEALDGAVLLVNTTSLGMEGNQALELSLEGLPASAVVTDVVYTPLETPLLAAARARGNIAVDGLGMLLHQARPGFAAWFGAEPEVTPELVAHILGN